MTEVDFHDFSFLEAGECLGSDPENVSPRSVPSGDFCGLKRILVVFDRQDAKQPDALPIAKDHKSYRPLRGIYNLVAFETCPGVRAARSFIFGVRIYCDSRRTFSDQHLSKFTQKRTAVTLADHVRLPDKCVDHLRIRCDT
jgi:hypothetical protein